jgi:predicted phosphodiesterase
MSRYAVISDIHGNLHAFEAILRDMGRRDVQEIICLGDIVGYGPAPDTCLDLVIKYCSVAIQGNHDQAVVDLKRSDQFNGAARQAILWTQAKLGPLHLNALNRLRSVEFVGDLIHCVHDCPVPGPSDYIHDEVIAGVAFAGVETTICLVGHTHIPVVFQAAGEGFDIGAVEPEDVLVHATPPDAPIAIDPAGRHICNPGSVGQPRDADPRASYAVLDVDQMTFTVHRVDYDISAAQTASLKAGLPPILAERLAIGA